MCSLPQSSPTGMPPFYPFLNNMNPMAQNLASSTPFATPPALAPSHDIQIELENSDLWRKFHQHTTEMIVNKTGRRMFPTLKFKIKGLDQNATYALFLELAPVDDCRYKYNLGRWIVNGRADPLPLAHSNGGKPRPYAHPDSPAPGQIWMRQSVSFHRIKLTNNMLDPQGNVLLNSMHKYQPRLYVLRLHDYFPAVPQLVASAAFPETAFITVTAYQNDKIIELKIDHNPFAKGFRDTGSQASKSEGSVACAKRPSSNTSSAVQGYCESEESKRAKLDEAPSRDGSCVSFTTSSSTVTSTDTLLPRNTSPLQMMSRSLETNEQPSGSQQPHDLQGSSGFMAEIPNFQPSFHSDREAAESSNAMDDFRLVIVDEDDVVRQEKEHIIQNVRRDSISRRLNSPLSQHPSVDSSAETQGMPPLSPPVSYSDSETLETTTPLSQLSQTLSPQRTAICHAIPQTTVAAMMTPVAPKGLLAIQSTTAVSPSQPAMVGYGMQHMMPQMAGMGPNYNILSPKSTTDSSFGTASLGCGSSMTSSVSPDSSTSFGDTRLPTDNERFSKSSTIAASRIKVESGIVDTPKHGNQKQVVPDSPTRPSSYRSSEPSLPLFHPRPYHQVQEKLMLNQFGGQPNFSFGNLSSPQAQVAAATALSKFGMMNPMSGLGGMVPQMSSAGTGLNPASLYGLFPGYAAQQNQLAAQSQFAQLLSNQMASMNFMNQRAALLNNQEGAAKLNSQNAFSPLAAMSPPMAGGMVHPQHAALLYAAAANEALRNSSYAQPGNTGIFGFQPQPY